MTFHSSGPGHPGAGGAYRQLGASGRRNRNGWLPGILPGAPSACSSGIIASSAMAFYSLDVVTDALDVVCGGGRPAAEARRTGGVVAHAPDDGASAR